MLSRIFLHALPQHNPIDFHRPVLVNNNNNNNNEVTVYFIRHLVSPEHFGI